MQSSFQQAGAGRWAEECRVYRPVSLLWVTTCCFGTSKVNIRKKKAELVRIRHIPDEETWVKYKNIER